MKKNYKYSIGDRVVIPVKILGKRFRSGQIHLILGGLDHPYRVVISYKGNDKMFFLGDKDLILMSDYREKRLRELLDDR